MFGNSGTVKQNENTYFKPQSPYAISKVFAHQNVINYRDGYDLYAVSGILFNHESPLRPEHFITRKITNGLAKIIKGEIDCLEIGNIYSKRDWGFAGDYVEAMWKMMQQKKPLDFVIATGETHTVKEFINLSAKFFNLKTKWIGKGINECLVNIDTNKKIIKISKKYFRPTDVKYLKGDYSKAKKLLKWRPKTKFKDLVKLMCLSEIKRYL